MNIKRIHDISVPLRAGMPVWPGDPPFEMETVCTDPAVVSRISMCVHTGTHIDTPRHRDAGAGGVETIPLDILCGPCRLVTPAARDLTSGRITALPAIPDDTQRILIRTGFDHRAARNDSPYEGLSPELAFRLVESGICLVGTDSPTVETLEDILAGMFTVHDAFLQSGMVIVENLDLSGVPDGVYQLICLPLLIPGSDGAPARAVLKDLPPGLGMA